MLSLVSRNNIVLEIWEAVWPAVGDVSEPMLPDETQWVRCIHFVIGTVL
jgi:hypothetical protein